jgi:opacity protein-like surface antigen
MKPTLFQPSFVLLTGLAFVAPAAVSAQAFPEGSNSISIGYGGVTLLSSISKNFDNYADVKYSGMGPIYFKFEHAMTDNLGLGVNVAYATNEWNYKYTGSDANGNPATYTETTTRSTYSILARLNYHIGSNDKFDPYLGLGLGYRDATWKYDSTAPEGTSGVELKGLMPLGMELTMGLRYFFTDNIGLYAEFGAAKSVLQGGLSVKF